MEDSRQKISPYLAFVAGHFDNNRMTSSKLEKLLQPYCEGNLKVQIPFKRWKGFAFIRIDTKSNLDKFLQRKTLEIKGNTLIIKKHTSGKSLKKMKKETKNRRIFVRLMAKKPVSVDFESHFSVYGEIESCYIVNSSLVQAKNKFTYIGYVVFKSHEPAQLLVKQYKLKFRDYYFLIKKIDKNSDSGSSSSSNPNSKKNPSPPNHEVGGRLSQQNSQFKSRGTGASRSIYQHPVPLQSSSRAQMYNNRGRQRSQQTQLKVLDVPWCRETNPPEIHSHKPSLTCYFKIRSVYPSAYPYFNEHLQYLLFKHQTGRNYPKEMIDLEHLGNLISFNNDQAKEQNYRINHGFLQDPSSAKRKFFEHPNKRTILFRE